MTSIGMTNRDIKHIPASCLLFKALNCCWGQIFQSVAVPVENCLWPIPGLQDGPALECSSQVIPVKETHMSHVQGTWSLSRAELLWSTVLSAAACGHLGLVADCGKAAVVDEGEHALAVVARDELHRNTDAVDVRVTRATSHLKYGFKNIKTWKQRRMSHHTEQKTLVQWES